MLRRLTAVLALVAACGLAACGSDPLTRGLTGGAIGAGVGAGAAAVTHGDVGTGALIGGGIGAVGGVATTP